MSSTSDQKHILAINNNPDVLSLFTDLLEDEGYRVSTQVYVDHDLPGIEATKPDLLILDYMWASEDDGWSLLQMLRMNPPTARVPIILCTGAVARVRETDGHLATMGIEVIFKPFNIEQLLETIERCLNTTGRTALG
jgi:DNA-binding response OmpR family regulator